MTQYDAVVVGAGFAGMYMLHRLREQGLSAIVYETGDGVGGTWHWNRYPGARCDVESMEYSYQFDERLQQEWDWSERYAAQPEILDYANHVADRFQLRDQIQFNTRVTAAHFNEGNQRWQVETAAGDRVSAQFLIMATGCLSSANVPNIPGLENFQGGCYHTGQWPKEGVDFNDREVAVIGTGSSAIQAIPVIAEEADHLTVLQRTPCYSVPAQNYPLSAEERQRIKANYGELRQRQAMSPSAIAFEINPDSALEVDLDARTDEYERRWQMGGLSFVGAFGDLLVNGDANDTAAEFIRGKIRSVVKNPRIAEILSPMQTFGCKRVCADSGYYDTFNRDNVSLVDLIEEPIQGFMAQGIVTAKQVIEADAIIFATGFDAVTGALARIDIRGREGLALTDKWAEGPRALLGLNPAGFPNLFTITGPGSPSVLTNMLPSIEQHVEWISDCLAYLAAQGHDTIEATAAAEQAWVAKVNALAEKTLYPTCNSWYLGANIPGKPRVFMPYIGFPAYVQKCAEIAAEGYVGFELG